jgi:rod shape-determining protein MreD
VIRFGAYLVLVAAGLVLEMTWLARATVAGVAPDPLVIFVMVVGLLRGSEEGALVGAGVGLLQDVVTGVPLGLGMLADLVVGFVAGMGGGIIYIESVWMPAAAAAALSVLRVGVWALAAHLVGLLGGPLLEVVRVAVVMGCYNGLIAIPIFHGLRSLERALVRLHEESR